MELANSYHGDEVSGRQSTSCIESRMSSLLSSVVILWIKNSPGEQEPDDCIDNMFPVSETATIPWPRDDLSVLVALAFARLVPCSRGFFRVDNLILAVLFRRGLDMRFWFGGIHRVWF